MPGRYRSSMCKGILEHIEATAPELVPQLPGVIVEQIRGASRADWIPAADLDKIYTAIMIAAGEGGLRKVNRGYTHKAMNMPVFGPLLKGATNLFGGGPKGVLRVMPNSWELVTRECGSMAVEFPAEGQALVRYSNVAPEIRSRSFVVSSSSSPLGVFDGLGFRGSVEADDSKLSEGVLVLRVRWHK
jgi:hypothetical protein